MPMFVVTGIPISRGIAVSELSYYTVRTVHPGSVVMAPIRGTVRPLFVTKVTEAAHMKQTLRSQHFTLQKLGADAPVSLVFPEIARALSMASAATLAHHGALLSALIPEFALEEKVSYPHEHAALSSYEHIPVQASTSDRMSIYKNMVRESFAKSESVYVVVPTRSDVLRVSEELAQGVSQYIIPLHGSLSTTIARTRWKDAITREHPVVIVATPTFLSLPRHDLGTIICEKVSDTAYVRQDRPYIPMHVVAQCVAEALNVRFVSGDTLLPAHISRSIEEHTIDTPYTLTTKAKGAPVTCIQFHTSEEAREARALFHPRFFETIGHTLAMGKSVVCVAPRKGLATHVVCRDCSLRAVCPACGNGYRLHSSGKAQAHGEHAPAGRVLACARCGHSESANVTCAGCGSWKLAAFGIGDETLAELFQREFPHAHIVFHGAPEKKGTKKTARKKDIPKPTTPTLHIGTLSLLGEYDALGLVVFPSLESLLSVPTIDADIDAARALARARECADAVLVHTRAKDIQPRMQYILDGALAEIVRSDLATRKALAMPPYIREIRLCVSGSKQRVIDDVRTLLTTLKSYRPEPQQELVRESSTTVSHTTRINLPHDTPLPESLIADIHTLPPSCAVFVSY